jgi:hypothetical protein
LGSVLGADVIVLRRAPRMRWLARAAVRARVLGGYIAVVLTMFGFAGFVWLAVQVWAWGLAPYGLGLAVLGVVVAWELRRHARWSQVDSGLAGLEWRLASGGVVYRCWDGQWNAPWPAVRRIAVAGRPGGTGPDLYALLVDVDGWGGPLVRFGHVCQLGLLLDDTGADLAQVDRLVRSACGGRLALTVPGVGWGR